MSAILPKYCPKYNYSHRFYRFGKDKSGNRKYQCQSCKHQFTLVCLYTKRLFWLPDDGSPVDVTESPSTGIIAVGCFTKEECAMPPDTVIP